MFAQNDQSTKRRIAGYLGGVFGAACVLLAASPGLATGAAAAPALDKLTLTSVCTLPKGDAVLRVGNTNALAITYTWDINKTSFAGKAVATAGDSYLLVPSSSAGNTRLFVDGKQQVAKAQNGKACVFHVQPVKRWVDASGADLAAPVVPKGWKLTLDSDLETVTCTWKKSALSCTSKVDAEDKGDFTNEKPNLDVPFGGSYTITETSTSDFKQEGTGTFGPLDEPKDLDAYFVGDDTVVAVVTNHLVGEAAPSTTAEETTTTTEAPPTTLAVQDETTTSTTAEDATRRPRLLCRTRPPRRRRSRMTSRLRRSRTKRPRHRWSTTPRRQRRRRRRCSSRSTARQRPSMTRPRPRRPRRRARRRRPSRRPTPPVTRRRRPRRRTAVHPRPARAPDGDADSRRPGPVRRPRCPGH